MVCNVVSDLCQICVRFHPATDQSPPNFCCVSPLELVYEERFAEALQVYQSWLKEKQLKALVSDGRPADLAIQTLWDLRSQLGSRGAKKISGALLDISVELFPDDSATSRFMMRFYKRPQAK